MTGPAPASGTARVLEENIGALVARRRRAETERSLQERVADGITRFTGSMEFVGFHVVLFGAWIANSVGWTPWRPLDPTLVVLAMAASVEAIFLSTFVLITQNRMARQAARQADLDVQISLLAEHEITRVLTLVRAIAERMQLEEAHDPQLGELTRDVEPEQVLDAIERQESATTSRPL
jgi:uncharacterized membrane protein